jgi:hypothetical protein
MYVADREVIGRKDQGQDEKDRKRRVYGNMYSNMLRAMDAS